MNPNSNSQYKRTWSPAHHLIKAYSSYYSSIKWLNLVFYMITTSQKHFKRQDDPSRRSCCTCAPPLPAKKQIRERLEEEGEKNLVTSHPTSRHPRRPPQWSSTHIDKNVYNNYTIVQAPVDVVPKNNKKRTIMWINIGLVCFHFSG